MHTEIFDQTIDRTVVNGMAAEGMLGELEISPPSRSITRRNRAPEQFAMRGLILAVPLSLSLWVAIGLLVWTMVR